MTPDEKWLLEEKYSGIETPEYEADKKRLASGEPLAYVIGWQPFLGLKIYLDSKPLIPRPETEWWTEELVAVMKKVWPSVAKGPEDFLKDGNEFRFLDLCAGSGAIGCAALAKLPDAQVYFGEIDPAFEATILKNIRENKLDLPTGRQATSRADVRIGDLFEPFATNFSCPYSDLEKWKYSCGGNMQFDIIAANPPYVPADRVLPPSVAEYEPAGALRAGEDGLDIIRRIALDLPKHLKKDGQAWIECDRAHAAEARTLFQEQGFSAEIRNDQYGKPRIIVVSFP
ncbi:MAG: peptide chain release factor N(5)-glutamine methyltransferase [Candidatus Parcubacteria bacterium]|nr:peptide chain release factor N(5)-glutamine methyltransferase [Candidatus Parcubacteria bacterium]